MITKSALIVCLQAFLIQGFAAQCIGAYNGLAAAESLSWPAANSLAWEGGMSRPAANALAWDSAAPWLAASPYAASTSYAAGAAPWSAVPFAATEWGAGYSPASLGASNGGGLAVKSASPIAPTGVSMNSENIYEGPLAVSGAMPFLGAVALEGALPTGGAGAVAYGCGNGNVAMTNEDYGAGYGVGPLGNGVGIAGPAYGYNGLAGPVALEAGIAGPAFGAAGARFGGCGCGAFY